jgi:uncharacterized membrane protein
MAGVRVVSAPPETSLVVPADDVRSLRSLAPVVAALATIHAGIMLTLALRQHRNFDTYGFDFGIYDQAWWLVGQKGGGFDTVRGLPIWGHHPNLVLWLLAPFARLGLGNWFLVAIQTLVLSLGALPVYWIAQDRLGSNRHGLLLAVSYLLYPPTSWLSWTPFHPECLAVTPMLFAIWFASQHRWRRYFLCIAIVLSTREEAAIVVALYGLILLRQAIKFRFAHRIDRSSNIPIVVSVLTFFAGIIWFLLSIKVIIPNALGGENAFYVNHFFASYGESLGEVATHLAGHPSEIVRASTTSEALRFQADLLGPLGFLPLVGIPMSLLALPQLSMTLLGSEHILRQITNQYTALMIPGLMVGTIDGLARCRRRWAKGKPLVLKAIYCWFLLSMLIGALMRGPLPGAAPYAAVWRHSPPANAAALRKALDLIPDDAAVTATGELVPHLTHREIIYNFPNPFQPHLYGLNASKPFVPKKPDWVIVNRSGQTEQYRELIQTLQASDNWETIFDQDGVLVLRAG